MTKFAANLSMLFTELPFLDRFAAAAEAGFGAVEFLFPYEEEAAEIRERLDAHGLELALFNLPPGDWAAGERGIACLPGRDEEFLAGVALALDYAAALGCPKLHLMAGLGDAADPGARERYVARVRQAAELVHAAGRTLLIEPINPIGMPGYFLNSVRLGRELLEEIDHPGVNIQLDLFHAQITDGDLSRLIAALGERIGHVQIASVPERNEPDGGETNLGYLMDRLAEAGYRGWVGCEYVPAAGTVAGLGWLDRVHRSDREAR